MIFLFLSTWIENIIPETLKEINQVPMVESCSVDNLTYNNEILTKQMNYSDVNNSSSTCVMLNDSHPISTNSSKPI